MCYCRTLLDKLANASPGDLNLLLRLFVNQTAFLDQQVKDALFPVGGAAFFLPPEVRTHCDMMGFDLVPSASP